MRGTTGFVGLVLLLAVGAAPAAAQLPFVSASVAAGPSFPAGDFADVAGTGFVFQGSLGLEPPVLPLGVRADVLWQQLPDEVSGEFRELGFFLNATLGLPLVVAEPYVLGGIGTVEHEVPEQRAFVDAGRREAWAVGAGVRVNLLALSAFAEARYLDAGAGHTTTPVLVGVRF